MFISKLSAVFLVAFVFVAACAPTSGSGDSPESSPAKAALTRDELTAVMTGSGDSKLQIKATAVMPDDFDDGQPERTFTGTGFIDSESALAGITYDLSKVPNAAGYFGQADGKTSVYYSDGGFTLSFPLLAEALGTELDWLAYELSDFGHERIRKLGIGQLREIGLSDPLLALALLHGSPNEFPEARSEVVQGVPVAEYEMELDVGEAAQAATTGMSRLLGAVRDLGVSTIPTELYVDDQDRVREMNYLLSYPPAPGSAAVELSVSIRFLEFGMEGGLSPPPDRRVADYRTYVAR